MSWKADFVQGVAFPLPGVKQSSALELWRTMRPNTEPDAYQGAGPSPMAPSQASGIVDGFNVLLSTQIGRINVMISPPDDAASPNAPPQIADLSAALRLLEKLFTPILDAVSVARVATLAQMSIHFTETAAIVPFINECSGANFPPESMDNIYQLNVRKSYEAASGIPMNRVLTWSAGAKQLMSAQIDFIANNFGPSSTIIIPIAGLKLDINSASAQDLGHSAITMFREQCREIFELVSTNARNFRGQ